MRPLDLRGVARVLRLAGLSVTVSVRAPLDHGAPWPGSARDIMAIQRADVGRGIELAYEPFGAPSDPPLLLVMGLATQMLGWPDEFCAQLAGRELFVVRFDNRDVGLSTHLDDAGAPDVPAALMGDTSSAAYTLSDMARDVVGLLDRLGVESAHVVGASMGGMIAQTLAIEHPERVRTLTSIMSTTGDPRVGGATQQALGVLLAPPARDRAEAIERTVATYRVIGSPGYKLDEPALRERAGLSFDRGYDPAGAGRQLLAVLAADDRTERLRRLRVPTLVIHGRADPLVASSGGRATAAAVPGAELVELDGMGHDLPRALWPDIADRIAGMVKRVEDERLAPRS
jgi:pimeloyl-ACP methyl ester carboxylesterase